MAKLEHQVCASIDDGPEQKKLYGLRFDMRNFIEQAITEFTYSILGVAGVPLLLAIQGYHGCISQGFIPGQFSSGGWNLRNYCFQLLLTLMVQFLLLGELGVFKPSGEESGNRFSDILHPIYDTSYVLILYSARNLLVALKYSFVARERLLEIRRYGRTAESFFGEMIIAFAMTPSRFMLYDQLEVSYLQHAEPQSVTHFILKSDIDESTLRALEDQVTRCRVLHTHATKAKAVHKAHQEIMPKAERKGAVAPATEDPETSCRVSARQPLDGAGEEDHGGTNFGCSASDNQRRVAVRALVFDHVIKVYREGGPGGNSLGAGIKITGGLLVAFEVTSAYKLLEPIDVEWWHAMACVCVGLLRVILVFNIAAFMLAARHHFARLARMLKAHLCLLGVNTDAYAQTHCQSNVPHLELLHVPNLHAWIHSFGIVREFGKVFTTRYNACVIFFLLCTTLQLFMALIDLMLTSDPVSWQVFGPCFFAIAVLIDSVLRSLICAARVNRLHLVVYPRALVGLRARVREHQWRTRIAYSAQEPDSAQDEGNDSSNDPSDLQHGELRRLFAVLKSPERVNQYLDHVVDTLELAGKKIALVAPIGMLGETITNRVLKSALTALLTTCFIMWNAININRVAPG